MAKTTNHSRTWQKAALATVLACGLVLPAVGQSAVFAESNQIVKQESGKEKKLSKLTINIKTIQLKKTDTKQLAVTAAYSDKTTEDVTQKAEWATTDSEIATVENGLVTAVDSGKSKIVAYYAGKSVSVPVEIEVVSKLTADQKKLALSLEATKQVNLSAIYSDKSTAAVTEQAKWESADNKIVTVEGGLVTAVGSGKTKVIATYAGKTVTIPVEVDVISKLAVDQKALYVRPGATKQVALLATLTTGAKVDVTSKAEWSTDNSDVATVVGGVVTGVGTGKAKITAKYGGKTVTVPVESAVIAKMDTDVRQITLKVGESKSVKAIVTYTDKTITDVTAEADWTSIDKAVAGVSGGTITSIKAGKTTVLAAYSGKVVKVQVTVK